MHDRGRHSVARSSAAGDARRPGRDPAAAGRSPLVPRRLPGACCKCQPRQVGTCRAWLVGVLTAVACGALSACAVGDGPQDSTDSRVGSATPTSESPGEPGTASTDPSALSGTLDIGGGRELYVECAGTGRPTILLEAGDNGDSGQWSPIFTSLAEQSRTCAYDRAGLGRSDSATGCRQLDDLLDDTEALLQAARIDPPYLLVGSSGGGYLMAGLAARHPEQVNGLVLLETPKEALIF